ncbi:MAG: rhodanese-like domain-containing protein, partial [Candidatus Moraniibacteriota bacterium]
MRPARHEGRALGITFLLLLCVVGIFVFQYFSKQTDSPGKESGQASVDLRELRSWNAPEVKRRVDGGEKIVFIDLRSSESYSLEHIYASTWFPLEKLSGFTPLSGEVYVLVVDPGISSTDLVNIHKTLKEKTDSFAFLQGGIDAWRTIGEEVISFGEPNSYIDQSKVTFVSSEKAKEDTQKNLNLFFLDVQEASDFASGHIPGAINVPLAEIEKKRSSLPLGKTFIVY